MIVLEHLIKTLLVIFIGDSERIDEIIDQMDTSCRLSLDNISMPHLNEEENAELRVRVDDAMTAALLSVRKLAHLRRSEAP